MLQVVEDMRQKQHKVAASQGNPKLINNFEFKKTQTHSANYPNAGWTYSKAGSCLMCPVKLRKPINSPSKYTLIT